MKRSAAASSSSVRTPGRILPSISSSVSTRIAPARAIFSISAGVFLTITRPAYLEPSRHSAFECRRTPPLDRSPVAGLAAAIGAVNHPDRLLELVLEAQRGEGGT